MNQIILGYVRITCYAALCCLSILIGAHLPKSGMKEMKAYLENLVSLQQQLNKEVDAWSDAGQEVDI